MATKKTLYQILEVQPDAPPEEIASAYDAAKTRLSAEQADANALVFAREAYSVLSDPGRRAAYDASLTVPRQPAAARLETDEPSALGALFQGPGIKWLAGLILAAAGGYLALRPPAPPRVVLMSPPVLVSVTGRDHAAPAGDPPAETAAEPATAPVAAAPPAGGAEGVFSQVSRSVATVLIRDASGRSIGNGSAVVIEPNVVITNCHVANAGAQLEVKIGQDSHPAYRDITDEELDLCRLSVPGLEAQPVTVDGAASLRVGQRVFAVGAPQGLELTLSDGIVSSLRDVGKEGKVIQTTAPVSPGSSGGGLFDEAGRLVGIVTFQHRYGQNLNFAVPAEWISRMQQRSASAGTPDVRRAAAPSAGASDSNAPGDLIVGTWGCFASVSGRNGEYTYDAAGIVTVVPTEGRAIAGRYAVAGRSVRYTFESQQFIFIIEEITRSKMVLKVVEGHRLVCERG